MFYIFAPKLIKLGIGHKNSRQVKFTFSAKAERATLQHFGECMDCKYTAFFPIIIQKCYIINKL